MKRVAVACAFAVLLLMEAYSQEQKVFQLTPGVYFWQGNTEIRRPADCTRVLF